MNTQAQRLRQETASRQPVSRTARALLYTFALIGLVVTGLFITGLVLDVGSFDNTRGGYDYPYTDFSGTPTDWTRMDSTADGMAYRGYVMNLLVDCRSGMMTFELFRQRIPFRPFSPRALAVHQPREACITRGFSPDF